jgi:hypothetical protein
LVFVGVAPELCNEFRLKYFVFVGGAPELCDKFRLEYFGFVGGAPELCDEFRFLVSEGRKLGKTIIVRSNLTVHTEPGQKLELSPFVCY